MLLLLSVSRCMYAASIVPIMLRSVSHISIRPAQAVSTTYIDGVPSDWGMHRGSAPGLVATCGTVSVPLSRLPAVKAFVEACALPDLANSYGQLSLFSILGCLSGVGTPLPCQAPLHAVCPAWGLPASMLDRATKACSRTGVAASGCCGRCPLAALRRRQLQLQRPHSLSGA